MERLQKYMASCGVCSRRKAEEYIKDGKVSVNGETITEMGYKVGKDDVVRFMDKVIMPETDKIYIMLNKPEGCLTTVTDDRNRKTVMDLISGITERIYPVGRLDYNTSGLLILTNDGEAANHLTHPRNHIDKVYEARVQRIPEPAEIFFFESGIFLDGRKTAPSKLEIISEKPPVLRITIHEGRNRQVRRMLEEIDNKAITLKRISVGQLFLGDLKKGKFRKLTENEINYIRSL